MSFRRLCAVWVLICFASSSVVTPGRTYALTGPVMGLPVPGQMLDLSPEYAPVLIKGLKVHPENPLLFDFIIDPGNSGLSAQNAQIRPEAQKLIKYFLATLTIPENDLWVNLSPYEKDRTIPSELGQTELGAQMLAQDYILKQLTASLIYPEKGLGRDFWERIYKESQERFGTTQIPVNTFNKVWIVADKAGVFVHNNTAFVVESHLKVMLEEDYLSLSRHVIPGSLSVIPAKAGIQNNNTHVLASHIIREIILPAIEKEVNEGKNFAPLRQIYNSMILAAWYKKNLKEALLNQVYADKSKINGVDVSDKATKEKIYERYLQAYKKGVFNYIKEDLDPATQQRTPRKYFSGGEVLKILQPGILKEYGPENPAQAAEARAVASRAMLIARTAIEKSQYPPKRLTFIDLKSRLKQALSSDFEPQIVTVIFYDNNNNNYRQAGYNRQEFAQIVKALRGFVDRNIKDVRFHFFVDDKSVYRIIALSAAMTAAQQQKIDRLVAITLGKDEQPVLGKALKDYLKGTRRIPLRGVSGETPLIITRAFVAAKTALKEGIADRISLDIIRDFLIALKLNRKEETVYQVFVRGNSYWNDYVFPLSSHLGINENSAKEILLLAVDIARHDTVMPQKFSGYKQAYPVPFSSLPQHLRVIESAKAGALYLTRDINGVFYMLFWNDIFPRMDRSPIKPETEGQHILLSFILKVPTLKEAQHVFDFYAGGYYYGTHMMGEKRIHQNPAKLDDFNELQRWAVKRQGNIDAIASRIQSRLMEIIEEEQNNFPPSAAMNALPTHTDAHLALEQVLSGASKVVQHDHLGDYELLLFDNHASLELSQKKLPGKKVITEATFLYPYGKLTHTFNDAKSFDRRLRSGDGINDQIKQTLEEMRLYGQWNPAMASQQASAAMKSRQETKTATMTLTEQAGEISNQLVDAMALSTYRNLPTESLEYQINADIIKKKAAGQADKLLRRIQRLLKKQFSTYPSAAALLSELQKSTGWNLGKNLSPQKAKALIRDFINEVFMSEHFNASTALPTDEDYDLLIRRLRFRDILPHDSQNRLMIPLIRDDDPHIEGMQWLLKTLVDNRGFTFTSGEENGHAVYGIVYTPPLNIWLQEKWLSTRLNMAREAGTSAAMTAEQMYNQVLISLDQIGLGQDKDKFTPEMSAEEILTALNNLKLYYQVEKPLMAHRVDGILRLIALKEIYENRTGKAASSAAMTVAESWAANREKVDRTHKAFNAAALQSRFAVGLSDWNFQNPILLETFVNYGDIQPEVRKSLINTINSYDSRIPQTNNPHLISTYIQYRNALIEALQLDVSRIKEINAKLAVSNAAMRASEWLERDEALRKEAQAIEERKLADLTQQSRITERKLFTALDLSRNAHAVSSTLDISNNTLSLRAEALLLKVKSELTDYPYYAYELDPTDELSNLLRDKNAFNLWSLTPQEEKRIHFLFKHLRVLLMGHPRNPFVTSKTVSRAANLSAAMRVSSHVFLSNGKPYTVQNAVNAFQVIQTGLKQVTFKVVRNTADTNTLEATIPLNTDNIEQSNLLQVIVITELMRGMNVIEVEGNKYSVVYDANHDQIRVRDFFKNQPLENTQINPDNKKTIDQFLVHLEDWVHLVLGVLQSSEPIVDQRMPELWEVARGFDINIRPIVAVATKSEEVLKRVNSYLEAKGTHYSDKVKDAVRRYLTGDPDLFGILRIVENELHSEASARWLLDAAWLSAAYNLNQEGFEYIRGNIDGILVHGSFRTFNERMVLCTSVARHAFLLFERWGMVKDSKERTAWFSKKNIELNLGRSAAMTATGNKARDAMMKLLSPEKRKIKRIGGSGESEGYELYETSKYKGSTKGLIQEIEKAVPQSLFVISGNKWVLTTRLRASNIPSLKWVGNKVFNWLSAEEMELPGMLDGDIIETKSAKNKAMAATPGGIDLNSRNMAMKVSGEKLDIHFDKAAIAQFQRGDFSGVTPVILKVIAIPNALSLLGLRKEDEIGQLAKA